MEQQSIPLPSSTAPARKSINQSKSNYQFIWKAIFIFISVVSTVLINKIYIYQTQPYFANIRKGSAIDLALYSMPFAIIFVLSDSLVHRLFDNICKEKYINKEKYLTAEAQEKRSYTLVKWGYSLFYYSTSSVAGYYVIKDTSFMPTFLGGDGYCTDVTRYIEVFEEANLAMHIFYVLQFGKHLGRFFQHLFIRSEGNFYEYALHHGISTFLIFFSFLMNMWIIGIFVLLIHDVSDFFLILARAYRDYKAVNKKVLQFIYVLASFSWVFCRVFLLSYCCVYSSLASSISFIQNSEKYDKIITDTFLVPALFMAFMLFALEILQIFWTFYIMSSFIELNVSKKVAKHTYD